MKTNSLWKNLCDALVSFRSNKYYFFCLAYLNFSFYQLHLLRTLKGAVLSFLVPPPGPPPKVSILSAPSVLLFLFFVKHHNVLLGLKSKGMKFWCKPISKRTIFKSLFRAVHKSHLHLLGLCGRLYQNLKVKVGFFFYVEKGSWLGPKGLQGAQGPQRGLDSLQSPHKIPKVEEGGQHSRKEWSCFSSMIPCHGGRITDEPHSP